MTPLLLQNDHLRLVLQPEIGGKMSSLQSVKTGREWLWTNPHLPIRPPTYGASYVETMDFGGWDEIFPSVSPTQVDGFDIPDHGDLAALPWEVMEHSATRVTLAVTTRFAPVRFERSITLMGGQVQLAYRMENQGSQAVPYLWCAHPLIVIEAGMRIRLPTGTPMRIDGGVGIPVGSTFLWPNAPGFPPLDRIPNPADPRFHPFAAKLFTSYGAVQEVALETATGQERLHLAWESADAPYLGLWLNCGGWSGCGSAPYFNLGVEPATAPFDDLGAAMKEGAGRKLAPGDVKTWGLTVRVG